MTSADTTAQRSAPADAVPTPPPRAVLRLTSAKQAAQDLSLIAPVMTIGRGADCELVLGGWNVARLHARLLVHPREVFIEDMGSLFGTWVNGVRVTRHGPLQAGDEILVGSHRLLWQSADRPAAAPRADAPGPAAPATDGGTGLVTDDTATCTSNIPGAEDGARRSERDTAHHQTLLHRVLLERLDHQRIDIHKMADEVLRSNVQALIREIVAEADDLPATIDRDRLAQRLLDEALGLGPLETLLADDSVSEIMVNRFDEIWVERRGRLTLSDVGFSSDKAVLGAIERIVMPLGRRIDEGSPMVDARLKDGSRVNAVIAPLALRGPSLTIRKFPRSRMGPADLVSMQSLSQPMLALLALAVRERLNIIVSGGTGTGKTTFLNMLSNFIPEDERIVTIEDAAELSLLQPNLVALECRPPNVEGKGEVTIRDLVRNALRMRPDRIVVGECRGGEALDMLQAMNTGHDGSLTTVHANTSRDALARLEVLVMLAGVALSAASVREQIASAVDLLVQLVRLPCGQRKVAQITEITGCSDGIIQMQDLFAFERTGSDAQGRTTGSFAARGNVPDFVQKMRRQGMDVDLDTILPRGAA